MSLLDTLIPEPRLAELDVIDLAASPREAWERVRHGDLGQAPLTRALFALRTIPERLSGRAPGPVLRLDALDARPEPGFHVLGEDAGHEVVVGAIGKVWESDITYADVRAAAEFASFAEPDFVRVAWALRVEPRGSRGSRVEVEVRVDATDEASWESFRRYFRVIGPASRFIRRSLLRALGRELGAFGAHDEARVLTGDDLLPDASEQMTHAITISAPPEAIWPWLVQMGCRRAGFYAYDLLDNGGAPSAREIHAELQSIRVGDVLPATPEGDEGFEVLRIAGGRALVLGGLFDPDTERQLPFASPRPRRFWHITWSFVLDALDADTTRLYVRARAAFGGEGMHAAWIRPVHHFMEAAQLRHLAARAEGTLGRDGWRDVAEGIVGAAGMAIDFLTPFLRGVRSRWGLDEASASRAYPGDELVAQPRWSWTHGVEIDAPPEDVWPWVVQIGADRGGFYSYQWLENLAGCDVRNAETVHPEWALAEGDALVLHPKMPPLRVAALEPGRWLVAHGPPDEQAMAERRPWAAASWLFFVEPLPNGRSRFISRFRSACSDDLATRLAYGPYVTESIGFVMDRKMLLGVRERVERRRREALAR